ncbi:MAG: hypothetical protein IKX36_02655 [Prevotella sp.]|nr:hypothetical protein [Prevotella sp.]
MKKILLIFLAVFVGLIVIIFSFATLEKTSEVQSYYNIPDSLREQVRLYTQGMESVQIAKKCVELTADLLKFSRQEDLNNHQANCVGYAKICASLCNYAFRVNHINASAKHVRGYVSCLGVNLCSIAAALCPESMANFVKDHDFVEIQTEGRSIYIDPSIYDLTGRMMLRVR